MRTALAAIVAAVLFTPTSSVADTISVLVKDACCGELAVSFGLVPFQVDGVFEIHGDSEIFGGSAHLVSGPLLDLDVDVANGLTTYSYGAGTLALTLEVEDEHFNRFDGSFLGTTSPFSFTVCEGCDSLFDGGVSADVRDRFRGPFRRTHRESVGQRSPRQWIPRLRPRRRCRHRPRSHRRRSRLAEPLRLQSPGAAPLELNLEEVPEPGTLVLGLVAAAGLAARRRRVT